MKLVSNIKSGNGFAGSQNSVKIKMTEKLELKKWKPLKTFITVKLNSKHGNFHPFVLNLLVFHTHSQIFNIIEHYLFNYKSITNLGNIDCLDHLSFCNLTKI